MTTVARQCASCANKPSWELTEEDFKALSPGRIICDKFPHGIPDFVEEGEKDCPEYREKASAPVADKAKLALPDSRLKRAQLADINFQRTYLLGEAYESIRARAIGVLGNYLNYPNLITFNDLDRSVTFSTERLVPLYLSNRPRVVLLFSNPHPHSVHQGMFLSPNTKKRDNHFWSLMRDAGWLYFLEENYNPKQLADICIKLEYGGPFDLIFYCYYAFPTNFPEDILKIFGRKYFSQFIEQEATNEFKKTIQEESVAAVVTFNKRIFNLVSADQIERYVERLKEGELIQGHIKGIDRYVPIFLTFPTGWRYHKQHKQFRKGSLDIIGSAICGRANMPESEYRMLGWSQQRGAVGSTGKDRVPLGWSPNELAHAATAEGRVAAEARILVWQIEIEEDERTWYKWATLVQSELLESAIVWFRSEHRGDSCWTLAKVFRHPREQQLPEWRLSVVLDAPDTSFIKFDHAPKNDEIYEFLRDARWKFAPCEEGFRLLDASVCAEAWKTATGQEPTKFYDGVAASGPSVNQ